MEKTENILDGLEVALMVAFQREGTNTFDTRRAKTIVQKTCHEYASKFRSPVSQTKDEIHKRVIELFYEYQITCPTLELLNKSIEAVCALSCPDAQKEIEELKAANASLRENIIAHQLEYGKAKAALTSKESDVKRAVEALEETIIYIKALVKEYGRGQYNATYEAVMNKWENAFKVNK